MVKIVFLSMPVLPVSFPQRKGTFSLFFKVKYVFSTIKVKAGKSPAGPKKEGEL
jgi:hypothetical protein